MRGGGLWGRGEEVCGGAGRRFVGVRGGGLWGCREVCGGEGRRFVGVQGGLWG